MTKVLVYRSGFTIPYNLVNQYITQSLCVHYILFLMYYEAKLMEFSKSSKFFRGKFIFLW